MATDVIQVAFHPPDDFNDIVLTPKEDVQHRLFGRGSRGRDSSPPRWPPAPASTAARTPATSPRTRVMTKALPISSLLMRLTLPLTSRRCFHRRDQPLVSIIPNASLPHRRDRFASFPYLGSTSPHRHAVAITRMPTITRRCGRRQRPRRRLAALTAPCRRR